MAQVRTLIEGITDKNKKEKWEEFKRMAASAIVDANKDLLTQLVGPCMMLAPNNDDANTELADLLEEGADPNTEFEDPNVKPSKLYYPLQYAAQMKGGSVLVKTLMAKNADPTTEPTLKEEASAYILHFAKQGNWSLARSIIRSVAGRDLHGLQREEVEELKKQLPKKFKEKHSLKELGEAYTHALLANTDESNTLATELFVFDADLDICVLDTSVFPGPDVNAYPLTIIAKRDDRDDHELFLELVAFGAELKVTTTVDGREVTPLEIMVEKKNWSVIDEVLKKHLSAVKKLKPEVSGRVLFTVVQLCAYVLFSLIVENLIKAGAKVGLLLPKEPGSSLQCNALDLAVEREKKEIVEKLLQAGAKPSVLTSLDDTVLTRLGGEKLVKAYEPLRKAHEKEEKKQHKQAEREQKEKEKEQDKGQEKEQDKEQKAREQEEQHREQQLKVQREAAAKKEREAEAARQAKADAVKTGSGSKDPLKEPLLPQEHKKADKEEELKELGTGPKVNLEIPKGLNADSSTELNQKLKELIDSLPTDAPLLKQHIIDKTAELIDFAITPFAKVKDKSTITTDVIDKAKEAVKNYEDALLKLSTGHKWFVAAMSILGAVIGLVGGFLAGLAVGAAIGGGLGSVVPVLGNVIGAIAGGSVTAAYGAVVGVGTGAAIGTAVAAAIIGTGTAVGAGKLTQFSIFKHSAVNKEVLGMSQAARKLISAP